MYDLDRIRRNARRYEERLQTDRQRFHERPDQSEFGWVRAQQREEDQDPAQSFAVPTPEGDFEPVDRRPSVSGRNARFRDQHLYGPPPPRPTLLTETYSRAGPDGPPPILLDQQALNEGRIRDAPPTDRMSQYMNERAVSPFPHLPTPEEMDAHWRASLPPTEPRPPMAYNRRLTTEPMPPYERHGQGQVRPTHYEDQIRTVARERGIDPDVAVNLVKREMTYAQAQPQSQPALSTSQKKRLRKRRKNQPPPHTEDLAVRPTNGYDPRVTPVRCPSEIIVQIPNTLTQMFRVRCQMDVNPHIGQPHIMPLSGPEGVTVFVGWWSEEEQG